MHDRRLRAHKWIQGSTQNDDDESTNGDAARQNLHPPDWRSSSDASRPSANRAPLCERRLCLQAPLCPQRHQSRLSTLRVQSDSGNYCDVGASASHGGMNGDGSTAAAAKRQLQRRHSDEQKESGDDDKLAGTLASFVRSTTFHGFDQLVHTEGWWARAFWVLTMCTVFVIVFVQLNTLVMYFVHNPTLTSIRLVYPERAHAHRSGAPPWGSPEGSDGDGDDQADLDEFDDDDDDDDLDTDEARRRRLARKRAPVGPVGGMGFVYWYPNSHLLDTAYNSYDEHAVHVYMSPLDAMLEKNPTVLPVGYHAHIALRATKTISLNPDVDLDNDNVVEDTQRDAQQVDTVSHSVGTTPAEVMALSKSKGIAMITDEVKAWVEDFGAGVHLSPDLCTAFKVRYKPLNNPLLDLVPRKDEQFSEGGKFATPNKAAVDVQHLKILSDNLFELDKVLTEVNRIPFALGDTSAVHRASIVALPASDGQAELADTSQYSSLAKDTYEAMSWLAAKVSQARLLVHGMRRMLCLAPFFRNISKRQLKAVQRELTLVGVKRRSAKEVDIKYPDKLTAPPLLFGHALLKKMRQRLKQKKRTDKVVDDLLGGESKSSKQKPKGDRKPGNNPGRARSLPNAMSMDGRRQVFKTKYQSFRGRQKMDHLGRAACTSPKLKYFDEYTYEACQVECLVDAVLERCNCTGVTSHGRIPQGRVCSPSMAIECYKQLALNFTQMLVRCRGDNCVEACEYWSYSSTLTVGRVFNPLLADKMTEYWRLPEGDPAHALIIGDIYFEEIQYTEVTQVPALTVETFISALGGCMGLWTGASIVTWIHLAYWCCVRSCGTLKQRLNVFRQNQLTKLCLSPRPRTTLGESGSRAPIAQMDNGLQSPNVDTAAVSDTERTNNNTRPYRTDTQITGTGGGGESDTDTEWDAATAAMSGLVGRRASYLAMVPRGSTEQPPDAQRRHGDGDATATTAAGACNPACTD